MIRAIVVGYSNNVSIDVKAYCYVFVRKWVMCGDGMFDYSLLLMMVMLLLLLLLSLLLWWCYCCYYCYSIA